MVRQIMGRFCRVCLCFSMYVICLFRTNGRVYERVSEEAGRPGCTWYTWAGRTSRPPWGGWSGRSSRSPGAGRSQRSSRLLWTSRHTWQERSVHLLKSVFFFYQSVLNSNKASPKKPDTGRPCCSPGWVCEFLAASWVWFRPEAACKGSKKGFNKQLTTAVFTKDLNALQIPSVFHPYCDRRCAVVIAFCFIFLKSIQSKYSWCSGKKLTGAFSENKAVGPGCKPLNQHQSQNTLLISGGEIVFDADALCKVEVEIQYEWKQEMKIKI